MAEGVGRAASTRPTADEAQSVPNAAAPKGKRRCNPATVGLRKAPPPERYSRATFASLLRQLRTARSASTQLGSNWRPDSETISSKAEAHVLGSR
jgi:hypothetical protein